MSRMTAALVCGAPGAVGAGRARRAAQTADEFYKGRQIRFIVGTAAGQDYDSWARLIGRHLPRYIPGNPTFIVENMPGAGHILATNYLFNLAPRDGSAIGMVSRNMTEAAVMKLPNVRFDPGQVQLDRQPRAQPPRPVRQCRVRHSTRCRTSSSAS